MLLSGTSGLFSMNLMMLATEGELVGMFSGEPD